MIKSLTLSIVIPVYNEEHHIKACLDAVAAQSVRPHEVIVVDNNSTDDTVKIAKSYPFVKVIREKRQGKGNARSAGLNAATGDILGRIDADSQIMKGWVERVLQDFSNDSIMGLTGPGCTDTLPFRLIPNFKSTIWSRGYFVSAHADTRMNTMWGANMAIRRTVWQVVHDEVCLDDKIVHEDIDLSLVMQKHGMMIYQDNELLVTTRGATYHYLPKMAYYFYLRYTTLSLHRDIYKGRTNADLTGFFRTQGLRILSIVPSLIFVVTSLLALPLDLFMLKVMKRKHWLD